MRREECFVILNLIALCAAAFDNIVVKIEDLERRSFNQTINGGSIEKETFKDIQVLTLYIRNQPIKDVGKDSVRHLPTVRTVSFWGNGIDTVQPGAFEDLPALKNLQLSYENLQEIPAGVFNAVPTIELLRIHDNKIDFIEDQAFANLASLKRIHLDGNQLEYWSRGWFTNTTNLEIIDFQTNHIRSIPRKAFANLFKLKQLFFDSNEISVIHPKAFEGIRHLEYLGLRYNRLTEIKEDVFPNDLTIRSFLLDANYLNFLPYEVLKKVSVKDITIDNNPWTCPCLDRINFWLFRTNGTVRPSRACMRDNVLVCVYPKSFSHTCLEIVDEEVTKRFIDTIRRLEPPLQKFCIRLD